MRALVISKPGEPDVLKLEDRPDPVPVGEEVRVRVHVAGLNRADLLQRRGLYPAPPGDPADIPGLEYSGIVDACGVHTQIRKPGDRVMGLVGGGAHAEYVLVHERSTIRVPDRLTLLEAAALPETFLTAYDALFLQGGLQPGRWCLIRAVTSGVGIAACQLAHALGSRVIGTSRSAERLQRVRSYGLDAASIDGEGYFTEVIQSVTKHDGVQVVLDLLGGNHLGENLRVLSPQGTLMLVGLLAGRRDDLDLSLMLTRRLRIQGTVLRSRPLEEKIRLARLFENRLCPLFENRRLQPVVDSVFPLQEAARAHIRMEEGDHLGKILLGISPKTVMPGSESTKNL